MEKQYKTSVLYAKIDTPSLVKVDIDFTVGAETTIPTGYTGNELQGALIRPVIRYRESDTPRVERELRSMLASLSSLAHHVFPPIKEIIRTEKTRDRTLKRDSEPVQAFGTWLDTHEREVKELNRDKLEELFQRLAETTKSEPQPIFAAEKFIIKKIGVENYIPFKGAHEVVGLDRGVYGVVGVYFENNRRSNRAGKSALLKGILTSLFGEDRSELGKGDSFDRDIHNDATKSRVALEIEVDGQNIEVVRERTRDSRPMVILNGANTSVTDTDKRLEELLKFEREDFVRIAFIRSGDLHGILSLSNAEIKARLLRWLGLEYWERLSVHLDLNELHDLPAQYALCKSRAQAAADAMHGFFESKPTEDSTAREVKWKALKDLNRKYDEALAEVKLNLGKVSERQRLQNLKRELKDAEKACERKFNGKVYTGSDELLGVLEEELEITERELRFARESNAGFTALAETKEKVDKSFVESGKCPIDAFLCPRVDSILRGLEARETDRQKVRAQQEEANKRAQDIRIIEGRVGSLKTAIAGASDRAGRVKMLREQIKGVGQTVDGDLDETLLAKKNSIERDIQNVCNELEKVERARVEQRVWEEKMKDTSTTLKLAEAKMKDLEVEIRRAKFVKIAVSRSGIPAIQLENALGEIEAGANRVLELIEAPHRMEFSFQKELKKLEDECSVCGRPFRNGKKCDTCDSERRNKKSEELSVVITDSNGRRQAFDQDSSGGQALVSLAVRISLAQYFGFNVLFLDEVCGSLDEENLEMLIKLLDKLPGLGFDQVFLISHRQRVMEMLENLIVVERHAEEGWSKVFLRK